MARLPGWRRIVALSLVLLGLVWIWLAPGLVSSNDGSHLALSRALVLHHQTTLGDEVALTLWVDRARRNGKDYSDRPPGTATLAAPAVWLGDRLDPLLLSASLEARELIVTPAAPRYAETYAIRVRRHRVAAPPLAALQGTAIAIAVHCAVVGALGVLGVLVLLRRRGVGPSGQLVAAATLGLGCLYGPYATVLFSHVTAAALLVWTVVALDVALARADAIERGTASPSPDDPTEPIAPRHRHLVAAGLTAAAAASTDYLVGLLVLGLAIATIPPRRWLSFAPWLLLGAVPVLAFTFAYHAIAFGSPWSIGYDHHANFEFARHRLGNFGGNPLHGLWVQWGAGEGAGILALAPIMLLGVVGLAAHSDRRWLLGALPWITMIAAHQTPTGGAAIDHRYLVPLMPLLAAGLGLAWHRWSTAPAPRARTIATLIVLLALASSALTWSHVTQTWT